MSLYEGQKLLFHVNREPKMFDRFLREREPWWQKCYRAKTQRTQRKQFSSPNLAPFAPLRETRFLRSVFHPKFQNIFGWNFGRRASICSLYNFELLRGRCSRM